MPVRTRMTQIITLELTIHNYTIDPPLNHAYEFSGLLLCPRLPPSRACRVGTAFAEGLEAIGFSASLVEQ